MRRARILLLSFLAIALTCFPTPFPTPPSVYAASIVVDTLADEENSAGNCSLREAIKAANGNAAIDGCQNGSGADTITFAVSGTITLSAPLPDINSPITIDGTGQSIIIDGASQYGAFKVTKNGDLTLNNLVIQNCSRSSGGAIESAGKVSVHNTKFLNNAATTASGGAIATNDINAEVTITNSVFSGNTAAQSGGAIYVFSPITVSHSIFANNRASNNGGGITSQATNKTSTVLASTFHANEAANGGGVYSYSNNALTVSTSTFSGNKASVGSGILARSTLVATFNTFAGNSVPSSGDGPTGIYQYSGTGHLAGNIFEGQSGIANCSIRGTAELKDYGYNLSSDATCASGGTGSVQNVANLNLGPLTSGEPGPLVHMPQAGSAAIDAIPFGTAIPGDNPILACTGAALDQLLKPRPLSPGQPCTVGAVEAAPASKTISIHANDPTAAEHPLDSGQFTVTLSAPNTSGAPITVTYAVSGTADPSGADYFPLSGVVSIPAGSASAVIDVTPVDDALDEADETVIVTLISTSTPDVAIGTPASATVTILDDDTAGININPASITTGEDGSSASFTVALASQPSSDVLVTFSGVDSTEGTLSLASLIFTPESWNAPQTVTVTGVDDALVDGNVTYTITATGSGGGYDVITATITVTNTDNDTTGIIVAPASITTGEDGSSASFTVVLASQPSGDVLITFSGVDSTEGTLSSTSLTFTPSNWNTPQSVTVTGVDDALIDGDITYTIIATGSGGGYDNLSSIVTVTNTDDDTAGIILTPTSITTGEDGSSASFTVVLTSQPSGDVLISFSGVDSTEGTLSSASLTFTPATWNAMQTVTVMGVDDAEVDGNVSYTITATGSGGGYDGVTATVTVTNTDDDTTGIIVSPASITTGEDGSSATFTVALASQPIGDVLITFSGVDASEGTLSSTSLTFTPATWNTPQSVTVTGVDDALADGDVTYAITATGSGGGYNDVTATVAVTNTDNDTAGIIVTPASITTGEDGSSAIFTVVLASQPSGDVLVTFTGVDASEGVLSPASLAFTPDNWNTPQSVTVTGVDDALADGNITYTITATGSGGGYDGVTATVTVTNTDDDTTGIIVSPTSITTGEDGSSASFTVALASQPSGNVLITFSGVDATEGTLSPASLTFTAENWNTSQSVTVTGVDDSEVDGDATYTITATGSGGGYDDVSANVAVTNTDDDTPITADHDAYTTNEGQSLVVDAANGVLNGDAGGCGAPLQAILATPAAHGTLTLHADGSFTYQPDAGFSGMDSFSYYATDGTNTSAVASVTIMVVPVPATGDGTGSSRSVVAADDSAETPMNTPVRIDVLANDSGERLVIASISQPAYGWAALDGAQIVYTPAPGFSGADRFTYTVQDSSGAGATASVTVMVWRPVPLCADFDGSTSEIIRADVPDSALPDGTVFCRTLVEQRIPVRPSAEIGRTDVLSRDVIHAIDMFALRHDGTATAHFDQPITVCLQGTGTLLYLDATAAPRTISVLPSFTQQGYTCASVPNAGTVALVSDPAGVSGSVGSPSPGSTLSGCTVTTRDILNLRAAPDTSGAVIRLIPFDVTLTAFERSGGWYYVDYLGERGWLSADYVTPSDLCTP